MRMRALKETFIRNSLADVTESRAGRGTGPGPRLGARAAALRILRPVSRARVASAGFIAEHFDHEARVALKSAKSRTRAAPVGLRRPSPLAQHP